MIGIHNLFLILPATPLNVNQHPLNENIVLVEQKNKNIAL